MTKRRGERKGRLRQGIDPDTKKWQEEAATNVGALSAKQRYDRQRVRLRLDVPPWLKTAVEETAENEESSISQLGAFLLAWALRLYRQGSPELIKTLAENKCPSQALKIKYDLLIPEEIGLFLSERGH